MRADIDRLMQGELGDWLDQQVAMREEARKKAHNRWFYAGLAALPVVAFLWFGPAFDTGIKGIITFGICIAIYGWGSGPIMQAKRAVKIGINEAIARNLGISFAHEVEPGAEFDAARTYGLMPSFDRSSFEDRWYGDIEGHGFSLYEAHLEERRGSNKNRRWVTVFKGALIQIEFGRRFHSTTLLQRKGKHKKWLGLGGRKGHVSFNGHRLDYVDQVHPQFEEVFEVWSDDQVEARVLIHPSYVEHLLKLESAFNGDNVRALFSNGQVILAIESGNLFESGNMNASRDREMVEQTSEQFSSLAGLALAINQNERGRVLREE